MEFPRHHDLLPGTETLEELSSVIASFQILSHQQLSLLLTSLYRRVVGYCLYMKHSKVEVYLLDFKLCIHPKLSEHTVKSFSKADTIST